jgi:phage terminase large subunit
MLNKDVSNFTPKQVEAEKVVWQNKYTLYGGAMGGGKSYFERWMAVKLLDHYWRETNQKGIRVGLFCEDYPSLKDRHLSKIQYEFPESMGNLNKADHDYVLNHEGEGVICFRNLDDPSKYQSSEFASILVDEVTKNEEKVFNFLRTRLRWPGIYDPKFIGATNPGGIGHNWVRKLWMDKKYEPGEKEQDQFAFVPATAYDNPNLTDDYFNSLAGLPEDMKRAYLEGDWDLFEGQYFTEFRRDRHVVPAFPIPSTWKRFRAIDHGRTAPFCCLWFALDYDGRVWCYREYYKAGLNANQNIKNVLNLSEGEKYDFTVADRSIWAETGHAETLAEVYIRNGLTPVPSGKDRIAGWNLLHEHLYWDENTAPKLLFFDNCENTIRTLPSLIHDEHKPEDLDTDGEDHAVDALRYFLQHLRGSKTKEPLTEVEQKIIAKRSNNFVESIQDIYENK